MDRFVNSSEKVAQSKIIETSSGCIWSDGYPSSGDLCLPSNLCNSSNQKSTVAISSQDSVFGFSWSSLAVLRCRQHNCHNINLTPSSDQQTLACHTCSLISSQDSVFGFRVMTFLLASYMTLISMHHHPSSGHQPLLCYTCNLISRFCLWFLRFQGHHLLHFVAGTIIVLTLISPLSIIW